MAPRVSGKNPRSIHSWGFRLAYRKKDPSLPRVRLPVGDLQVNACHTPGCPNFGRPASTAHTKSGERSVDGYRRTGAAANAPSRRLVLGCDHCGVTQLVMSNAACAQERDRYLQTLDLEPTGSCPAEACANYQRSVRAFPGLYVRFGTTASGSQRYRCRTCTSTFSVTARTGRRLRRAETSTLVFRLLMNKSPMRRICEVADIHPKTLYQRIDLIHARTQRVAATHECRLLDGQTIEHMHLSVDRQDHTFNWGSHLDRRSVILKAIASADARSGYIVAQHLNYDPAIDPWEAELDARAVGDPQQRYAAYTKWARIRLPSQYTDTQGQPLDFDPTTAAPAKGVQVQESYALMGHFLYLERLLRGVRQLQFSLDQEPFIRAACLLSFAQRVRDGSVLAYVVNIDKSLTVEERKAELARVEQEFHRMRHDGTDADDFALVVRLLHERHLAAISQKDAARHPWIAHPLPTMNEPRKSVQCLTALPQIDVERLARGYARASLRAANKTYRRIWRR